MAAGIEMTWKERLVDLAISTFECNSTSFPIGSVQEDFLLSIFDILRTINRREQMRAYTQHLYDEAMRQRITANGFARALPLSSQQKAGSKNATKSMGMTTMVKSVTLSQSEGKDNSKGNSTISIVEIATRTGTNPDYDDNEEEESEFRSACVVESPMGGYGAKRDHDKRMAERQFWQIWVVYVALIRQFQ